MGRVEKRRENGESGKFQNLLRLSKKTAIRPIIHGKNGTAGFFLGFGLVGVMIVGNPFSPAFGFIAMDSIQACSHGYQVPAWTALIKLSNNAENRYTMTGTAALDFGDWPCRPSPFLVVHP